MGSGLRRNDTGEKACHYLKTICYGGKARYRHDLLLLGLGADGHTASLFPGTAALEETRRNVVSHWVPQLNQHRLTFTFPQINAARRVLFLVNDPQKENVLQAVLKNDPRFPATNVAPVDGEVTWLVG